MKDKAGNVVEVNDEVWMVELNYNSLVKGVIVKITPKTIFVLPINGFDCSPSTGYQADLGRAIKRTPDQIIRCASVVQDGYVKIPTSREEAELMAKLGMMYLEQNQMIVPEIKQ